LAGRIRRSPAHHEQLRPAALTPGVLQHSPKRSPLHRPNGGLPVVSRPPGSTIPRAAADLFFFRAARDQRLRPGSDRIQRPRSPPAPPGAWSASSRPAALLGTESAATRRSGRAEARWHFQQGVIWRARASLGLTITHPPRAARRTAGLLLRGGRLSARGPLRRAGRRKKNTTAGPARKKKNASFRGTRFTAP